jgi:nucleoside-diphosphate-sugar epimerase
VSRVLLTGAGGFVGRNAVRALLDQGCEIEAVSRHPESPQPGVRWHQADLLQAGAARRLMASAPADRLLHLAWYATPGSFWNAPENERWIEATAELISEFALAGGSRVTVAGSCAEYRWGEEMLSETDTPLEPATFYGACKRDAFLAASDLCGELGCSLGWGRVFFLYGPEEAPGRLVSDVARGLLMGERVPTTRGEQRRDFMHVADVAAGLVALLRSDVSGAVNIGTGHPVRVREIVGLIADRAAAGAVDYGALPDRPGEPEVIAAASERLREEVGFSPTISLERGMDETVAWHRAALGPPASYESVDTLTDR